MGIFKDIRGMKKQAKDLQKSGGMKRPSIRDGLSQASSAMSDMQTQQDLAANGTAATATIDAVRPTQTLVNQMPLVEYDLRIQLEGEEIKLTHQQATPQVYLAQLIPTATVQVLIDPSDTDKVTIVFA